MFSIVIQNFVIFQNLFRSAEVKKTYESSKVLLSHFLNGRQESLPYNGIRCLHYLCIQLVFQVVAFGFFQNYKDLKVHMARIIKKEKKQASNWRKVLPYFRWRCFPHMFEGPLINSPRVAKANFQVAFGYNVCMHKLMFICGKTSIEGRQEWSGISCKKRKSSHEIPACLLQQFRTCIILQVRTN